MPKSHTPFATTRQRPQKPRLALSIPDFCEAHGISEGFFYKLKKRGEGPREMKVGALPLSRLNRRRNGVAGGKTDTANPNPSCPTAKSNFRRMASAAAMRTNIQNFARVAEAAGPRADFVTGGKRRPVPFGTRDRPQRPWRRSPTPVTPNKGTQKVEAMTDFRKI